MLEYVPWSFIAYCHLWRGDSDGWLMLFWQAESRTVTPMHKSFMMRKTCNSLRISATQDPLYYIRVLSNYSQSESVSHAMAAVQTSPYTSRAPSIKIWHPTPKIQRLPAASAPIQFQWWWSEQYLYCVNMCGLVVVLRVSSLLTANMKTVVGVKENSHLWCFLS